jgi:hypothetical protein
MIFKIKHEKLSLLIGLIVLFIVLCALSGVLAANDKMQWVIYLTVVQLIVFTVFVIEQIAGTFVAVEDRAITIKRLFTKKTIAYDEMSDVQIERYKRMHKNHQVEYRMRMKIYLANNKKVVLTDTAMEGNGLLLRSSRELPDDETELYKVYQAIMSKLY